LFWEEFRVYEKSGDLWLMSQENEPDVEDERFVAAGIRALRDTGIGVKPTTYVLQLLGDWLSERVVELDEGLLEELVFGRETVSCELSNGYVALRFRGRILGCGLVTRRGLETQVPKGRAKTLRAMLEG
jgi:NOL1/NOP2/fmu family ribosome biogenesis protein